MENHTHFKRISTPVLHHTMHLDIHILLCCTKASINNNTDMKKGYQFLLLVIGRWGGGRGGEGEGAVYSLSSGILGRGGRARRYKDAVLRTILVANSLRG